MIGLVMSRPQVLPETIAGVEPLAMREVRWIKAKMLVIYNTPQIAFLSCMAAGAMGMFFVAALIPSIFGRLFFGMLGLMVAAFFVTCVLEVMKPYNHAHWDVMSYRDNFNFYGLIPARVHLLADRAMALGHAPMIEYLDKDPFLFIEVHGRRVYLAHWD